MKLQEITEAEFNKLFGMSLSYNNSTYFANGCVFDDETDNLIAFPWYTSATEVPNKYYKVVDNEY